MPYVETVLTERYFQYGIRELLEGAQDPSERWETAAVFSRVAYTNTSKPIVCCAQHYIFKSPIGDYFGIAITTDEFESDTNVHSTLLSRGMERLNSDRRLLNFYVYMLDKFDSSDNVNHVVSTEYSALRKSLDVENIKTDKPDTNQSPIVTVCLRERTPDEQFFSDKKYSSWWEDSKIRFIGYFDNRGLFFTVQADNAPNWTNNRVPRIPFYFGRFESFTDDSRNNVALFGGSFGEFEPGIYSPILPIRKSYPSFPSDGISSVMVKQTKYGSKYQEHFLSWNTISNKVEPITEGYPRGWKDHDKYQFNPSSYSGEVQASEVYIIHPEQGVYGVIPNIIFSNQLSILDGDILEVESYKCHVWQESAPHSHWERYRFTPIDSPSPITMQGKAVHRSAGLGIITHKKDF